MSSPTGLGDSSLIISAKRTASPDIMTTYPRSRFPRSEFDAEYGISESDFLLFRGHPDTESVDPVVREMGIGGGCRRRSAPIQRSFDANCDLNV